VYTLPGPGTPSRPLGTPGADSPPHAAACSPFLLGSEAQMALGREAGGEEGAVRGGGIFGG